MTKIKHTPITYSFNSTPDALDVDKVIFYVFGQKSKALEFVGLCVVSGASEDSISRATRSKCTGLSDDVTLSMVQAIKMLVYRQKMKASQRLHFGAPPAPAPLSEFGQTIFSRLRSSVEDELFAYTNPES